MDVYSKYMTKRAYEIALRIVRRYVETHEMSIVDAHQVSDQDLYWQSGYPLIR